MNNSNFFNVSPEKCMNFIRGIIYYATASYPEARNIMDAKFTQAVCRIVKNDKRYHSSAYEFVSAAVSYTIQKMDRAKNPRGSRHISGQELVAGSMAYAVEQFGPLAPEVLEDWGITEGRDIGNIVYNMIQVELLSASPEDSRSDFNCYPDIPGFLRRRSDEESGSIPPVKPPIIA